MSVEGTVTLDGRPLEQGAIQFNPISGTTSPTAGAEVVNGKYAIAAAGGPLAGKFTVQITAVGQTGRKIRDLRTNEMVDEYGECLPARYNSQSELTATVSEEGPNRFDFALKSK